MLAYRLCIFLLCGLPIWSLAQTVHSAEELVYVCTPCNNDCDLLEMTAPGTCPHCQMPLLVKGSESTMVEQAPQTIAFYLQEGVEVLDFAGPMEVFSYAGYEVFTVSKSKEPIKSQSILSILPDYDINDAPPADILAFFGGNGYNTAKDPAVTAWVNAQTTVDYYFSVCTGAFILAEAGILNGHTATTFHSSLNTLAEEYPEVNVLKTVRYVDNGKIITTAGISAGIDGALHLVAKLQGFNSARRIAYQMEYDKWTPGDGLILGSKDPYKPYLEVAGLRAYTGYFEFQEEGFVEIVFDEQTHSLYAVVAELKYPLFLQEVNIYETMNGQKLTFLRNDKGEVYGYKSTAAGERLFLKKASPQ